MSLFLGIDGGGSKTTCAVADEATVLGSATTGPSNMTRVQEAEARANLHAAIQQACAAAGVTPSRIEAACVGMAGASSQPINAAVRRILAEILPGEVEVTGDMVIAMEAAFAGTPGVIVIAGTGSIAFGRNQAGQTARAGGWGYAISDEGSGYWIGRAAVSAVTRACDCGQETRLGAGIMERWQVSSLADIARMANASPAPDFSQLSPLVLQAAGAGDPSAGAILAAAGRELAELARIVIARLWKPAEPVCVALGGGVFRRSPLVRSQFCDRLRAACPAVAVKVKIAEPVQGALWLARHAAAARVGRTG